MTRITIILLFLTIHALAGPRPACPPETKPRILLVGDSWASYLSRNQSLETMLEANGRLDAAVVAGDTAVPGLDTSEALEPAFLDLIQAELDANPTIDIVQITLGINDIFNGVYRGGWHTGLTEEEETALFDQAAANLATLALEIQAMKSGIRLVYSGYDYFNIHDGLNSEDPFFAEYAHESLGFPTVLELNTATTTIEQGIQEALEDVDVTIVENLGLSQNYWGYTPAGIGPGEIELPGDLNYPNAVEAANILYITWDPYHLNEDGYALVAQNLWNQYYSDALCIKPQDFAQAVVNCAQSGGDPRSVLWMIPFFCNRQH